MQLYKKRLMSMSYVDIANKSIGDSIDKQLKYLINLFRKIKKNYDRIDKQQRLDKQNSRTPNSHLQQVINKNKKDSNLPEPNLVSSNIKNNVKEVTQDYNSLSNGRETVQCEQTVTHTSVLSPRLERIVTQLPVENISYDRKINYINSLEIFTKVGLTHAQRDRARKLVLYGSMNAKEYEQIVRKELIVRGTLFDQLHNTAMKMLKPRWETDLCLKEYTYESLKIKENHVKYSAILSNRVKAIKEKKIEILKLADKLEYELTEKQWELYNEIGIFYCEYDRNMIDISSEIQIASIYE